MLRDSLAGIRVLDFSHVVAGPVCGMMFGDLGAEVTKVEPPDGELSHTIGPPWVQGVSVVNLCVNRNKRGLAVDLKTEAGRRIALALVRGADVLVESFRPGVMERFGLGWEQLRPHHPRLVYCSVSAYGQDGPGRERAGVDGIVQADTGLMHGMGAEGGAPAKVPVPVADMATGYLATIATLAALHQARTTGRGQHLDISLYNATLMLQQVGLASFLASGEEPRRLGSAAAYAAPNEAFPTCDGWVMVAAYQPQRWHRLCAVLGLQHLLQDPRFIDNAARVLHRADLFLQLAAIFRTRSTADWLPLLAAEDILCAPIAGYAEVTASAQYRHSAVQVEMVHPVAGPVHMPGFALGARDATPHRAAPMPGQHTTEVLQDLGYAGDEIAALLAEGVVAAWTAPAVAQEAVQA